MKHLDLAISELYHDELALADRLTGLSGRHPANHEIFQLGRDLATWSTRHAERLAEAGREYGVDIRSERSLPFAVVITADRESSLPAELHLLRELRALYCQASGVSLDWEILAQTAQALKDERLLALAAECHPDTLRQLRWANAALKENAPQIMITA